MRIAFSGFFLHASHTGTGRYIYNLLDALGRQDQVSEYHILSAEPIRERPDTPANMRWETVQGNKTNLGGQGPQQLLWEQVTFPRAARRLQADMIHVPYFAAPLRAYNIPVVVTILDMIPQRLPVYRGRMFTKAHFRVVERAARHASAIIAISQHCKQDIVDVLGIDPDRISVTYLAADTRFRPVEYDRQQELRLRLGLPGPFVLNVGGMDARKNLAALVEAFARVYAQLGNADLRLFIAGNPARLGTDPIMPDWRPLASRLGIAEKIICAPVEEADLATLYSATDCFAFTSLYEGFALTPLEAMACGAPVVCSNRTSVPEVVGEAALIVDPLDTEALSGNILRVLTSPETAQQLRAQGLARARTFTWERTAAETQAIYSLAARGQARPVS
ncbi:MAG TPA: glycosyltransferase family 1 protein [Ktedonobacterales bacterium]|nr:glycosyltransferase family 1 protein [Ktedonobacterales bacterium]